MLDNNPVIKLTSAWFRRNFSDPAAISLCLLLVFLLVAIEIFGRVLAPILISVGIAYLLHTLVHWCARFKLPGWLNFSIVYTLFIVIVLLLVTMVIPTLLRQLGALVDHMPSAISHAKVMLGQLTVKHPDLLSQSQVNDIATTLQQQVGYWGHYLLRFSVSGIAGIVEFALYLVLIPIMVFFFLKDSVKIIGWFSNFMPSNRRLMNQVWADVQIKIGAYVKGRVVEVTIMAVITGISFWLLGLQYSILLAVAVGLSVLVPYVGAVIVTIPVVIIGLTQWGVDSHFAYLMIVYGVLLFFDANILVPILFSEAMDLHPVAILIAIVIFGAMWGFWGVFFAIPLATLLNSVIVAWPREQKVVS
jgi:putative permease